MHFLVSLPTLHTHIAATNKETHDKKAAATAYRCVNYEHREKRLLAKVERRWGTVVSSLDKQIGSARERDVLRGVPRVPKFIRIIISCLQSCDILFIQDGFIEPGMIPHSINNSEYCILLSCYPHLELVVCAIIAKLVHANITNGHILDVNRCYIRSQIEKLCIWPAFIRVEMARKKC